MEKNLLKISALLKDKVKFLSADYRAVFNMIRPGDLVYLDPPYQRVTDTRDKRYFSGLNFDEVVVALETLNDKGVDYLVSYDGACGGKNYG